MEELIENSTEVICMNCVEADFVTDVNSFSNEDLTQKIIPGFFIILIAARFSYVHLLSKAFSSSQKTGLKPASKHSGSGFLSKLPWDGIIYLGSSGTGILLTVLLAQSYEKTAVKDIYSVTFYLSFALYGTVDTISYLKKGFVCEKFLKFLSLFVALIVDAVLYIENLQAGHVADFLQMATIIAAAFSTIGAFFNADLALLVGIALTLHGTWLLHSAGIDKTESSWVGIYFCWHLIIISLVFFIIMIIKSRKSSSTEASSKGIISSDSKFSSLKSAISTPSTALTSAEDRTGSTDHLDSSFLQKQMPVFSNSKAPAAGLSVLPSASSASSAGVENGNSTKNSIVRDWAKPTLSIEKETPSELRRTEIRTSFKPRHAVVGPSPALSQAVRSRSSEPVHSHSRNSDAVHSRSTVVDSPAPSTTSTAFSLNPAQIEECAAMEAREYQRTLDDHEQQESVVYENTQIGQPTLNNNQSQSTSKTTHNIVNNCIYSAVNKPATAPKPINNNNINNNKMTVYDDQPNANLSPPPTNDDYPVLVVESEPFDRISPIEEYNTLNRHVQNVRRSIKLKESKFV